VKKEPFAIQFYGKSELAMIYYPKDSKENALYKFRIELKRNPRLRHLINKKHHRFTPRQVKIIVDEMGEPY
jgi:hypothetical protein